VHALNARGQTPLDLAIAAESRVNFFDFSVSTPGPSASEVLLEFSAAQSER
jgi:hypothetical protein